MVSINNAKKNCILLFVKYPKEGQVKNRLIGEFNAEFVTELYKSFVIDIVSKIEKLKVDFIICFYPTDSKNQFIQWLDEKHKYIPQRGGDLGDRMNYCFTASFHEGYEKCVLIGSDLPDLPIKFIEESFTLLQKKDAVLGPTYDGGYYLIGFKKDTFLSEVFNGITWGSESVFNDTMNIFKKNKKNVGVLHNWHDIDTPNDLKKLFQRNQNTDFRNSHTMSFLMKNQNMFK